MEIEDALVDTHLPAIESVSSLPTRGFADRQLQLLGGHAHRPSDLQVLLQSLVLQFRAHLLESGHLR